MRRPDIIGRIWRDQRGATAIEYGLLVTLIGISVIGIMASTGAGTRGMWLDLDSSISDPDPSVGAD